MQPPASVPPPQRPGIPRVLVIGASVRAAAFSCRRAGWDPLAIDLFADADLRACCWTARVSRYPQQLVEVAAALPPTPWLYTGALENHPELVAEISRRHPLAGNSPETLQGVRDPLGLVETLTSHGFRVPATRLEPPTAEQRGASPWLRKPRASAAGRGITLLPSCAEPTASRDRREPSVYQQRIEGCPCSAAFVADGPEGCRLLYAAEQLIGVPWLAAASFAYAGSVGPLTLSDADAHYLGRLGSLLARAYGLRGLFGVDLIQDAEGSYWVLEVNPRYPASLELYELSTDTAALPAHFRATLPRQDFSQPPAPPRPGAASKVWGKAIVYARAACRAGNRWQSFVTRWRTGPRAPQLADLPAAGCEFAAGEPVTTVLVHGRDADSVHGLLRARAEQVYDALD